MPFLSGLRKEKIDQITLETLKSWRCKPAIDPEGKSVPVRIPFEVTFRIY
jgi:outer membrane biosynthesis protein TonB